MRCTQPPTLLTLAWRTAPLPSCTCTATAIPLRTLSVTTQKFSKIELSQSALSQHLAVLRDGGWVQTRRESQSVYYSVADGPMHKIIQTLHDIYCPTPDSD